MGRYRNLDSKSKIEDKNSNNSGSERILIGVIIYLIILMIISFLKREYEIFFVLFLILLFFGLIIIGEVMYQFNKINKFSKNSNKYYKKICNLIQRRIINNRSKKISKKITNKKIAYLSVFLFLPILFVSILVLGYGNYSVESFESKISLVSDNAKTQSIQRGVVEIKPILNNDVIKLSYFMGDLLKIPILNICFINNLTNFEQDINKSSFYNILKIENETYKWDYGDKNCVQKAIGRDKINYDLETRYEYPIKKELKDSSNLDTINPSPSSISLEINNNFIVLVVLVLLGWLAICHLGYSIYKNFCDLN